VSMRETEGEDKTEDQTAMFDKLLPIKLLFVFTVLNLRKMLPDY